MSNENDTAMTTNKPWVTLDGANQRTSGWAMQNRNNTSRSGLGLQRIAYIKTATCDKRATVV
jgi:hypothetical protein